MDWKKHELKKDETMKPQLLFLAITILCIGLCQSCQNPSGQDKQETHSDMTMTDSDQEITQQDSTAINGIWILESFSLVDSLPQFQKIPFIQFRLKEHEFNGNTGCNRMFGQFALKEDSIQIGPVATTRMFCVDLATFESDFIQFMDDIRTWKLRGNKLELSSETGQMNFKLQKPNAGTTGTDR